jgi:ABC-type glycerol-3-phosphate transport system substrate-binding protein
MLKKSFSILIVAATFACASGGAGAGTTVRRDSTIITADEITASHETNAYDAINQLRPLFLKSRGRTTLNGGTSPYAAVFVDGQNYGDLNSLRGIPSQQIKQIRYYNGPEAVTKFGMQYGAGVIAIETR